MINKGIVENNKKKIYLYNKYKSQREDLKKQIKAARYKNDLDLVFSLCRKLDSLPKNSSKTRIRNMCALTGRSRGLVHFKVFGICGIQLRENANKGFIPGVYKI